MQQQQKVVIKILVEVALVVMREANLVNILQCREKAVYFMVDLFTKKFEQL